MRRLNVGNPTLFDNMRDHESLHEFDDIEKLLDWKKLEKHLAPIYSSSEGGASYPPIMMFRAMLLQVWHNLSDVQTEKLLNRDLLFRRFCRLSLVDNAPDHSTISRFRSQLQKADLYQRLLDEVNEQLADKGAIVRVDEISILDASVIEAHQCRKKPGVNKENTQDKEAGWAVKTGTKGRKESTFGFKVHANVDEDGFVKKLKTTAGNVHDSHVLEDILNAQRKSRGLAPEMDSLYVLKDRTGYPFMELQRNTHHVFRIMYHFVWIPKYRHKVFSEPYRTILKDIIEQIGYDYNIEVVELEIPIDHIHMVVRSEPKAHVLK